MSAYQTTAGLAANVALLTSNNSLYLGGVAAASYQLNSTLAANVATLSSNNALYLGGVAAASYVNTSGAYTITGIHTHNASLVLSLNSGISANGSFGANGQSLVSNGSAVYWSSPTINTAAQYTWSNIHTFSANVNFQNTANVANLNVTGTMNAAGANNLSQTLTFASPNTVWATQLGTIASLTLTGNTTLTVTNPTIQTFILYVNQDSTGGRYITWGSNFKWAGGVAPVLTPNANSKDLISFVSDGTNMYGTFLPNVK
jgi:hypothetical protein